ncbi:MAG: hypothetical protein DRI90_01445 [Deltaproteobacteria bacterium]|nr:MAG: hypothetical protein DRI90_01445 [Deltaproteobacteria bacterium]
MPPSERPFARQTRLVFALHFHQPYGNLDEVFADAMKRCYLRTLDLLLDHPHVATAIHVSGPLLDWAQAHQVELIDKLSKLVVRGQVELLGGGYQEPMLAILPDRDAVGQLVRMADRCEALLGARPQGMWLAERVWEPDLARVIAQAGYRYTLLDDSHLRAAGAAEPLGAYYVTDKAGHALGVFPIDRGLRTRIPYAQIADLMGYLRQQRGRAPTYGDDVEKFGLWPTTERRVWDEAWLERFFTAAKAEQDWLTITTPGRVMADTPSSGAVYIPTISYAEMGSWALPPEASADYQQLAQRLAVAGFKDESESFLRGGIWQAFLAKYPESRLIYRKMLRVSAAVEQARLRGDDNYQRARDALYQGQCNCAYWHGLFGGLYLQHLRTALMSALLEAEALVERRDRVTVTQMDHDGDLRDEILFEGPQVNLYISPARGGSALELDLLPPRYHLTGVLGRRPEAYHEDVPRARVISDEELGNISAHDLVRATEEGLADKLIFDAYPRGAFVDHLLPADATPEAFDRDYRPLADLANAAYDIEQVAQDDRGARCLLSCAASGYRLRKSIVVGGAPEIAVSYTLTGNREPQEVCFASHVDITLMSPEMEGGRTIEVLEGDPGDLAPGSRTTHRSVTAVRVRAEVLDVDVIFRAEPAAELWRLPIETVSQSERGFERAYQGTALVFVWRGRVGSGATLVPRLSLELGGG